MAFALVQKDLSPVPAEKLKAAFRLLPQLIDSDAAAMAKDAYGILVEKLSYEDAAALQRSLAAQGVSTEVVDEGRFVALPPPLRVIWGECGTNGFTFNDPRGQANTIGWDTFVLIAAGEVRRFEWKSKVKKSVRYHVTPIGTGYGTVAYPVEKRRLTKKEERNYRLMVEVFTSTRPGRLRIMGDEFHYEYLGARMAGRASTNFGLLVGDLASHASGVVLNRGTYFLRRNPEAKPFRYPTVHAFEEEIRWLFWRTGKS